MIHLIIKVWKKKKKKKANILLESSIFFLREIFLLESSCTVARASYTLHT